jgi:EmrB/QacA subfamily drug resistance transporter
MPPAESPPSDRTISPAAGRWVLAAAILGSSMAFIDSTALNVALPRIQTDLNATGVQVLWMVNAYTMFLAALILIGGALGDRFGRRRVFGAGIALFAGASLACGLAPTPGFLIAARTVQGVGGALMVPGSLALITAAFERERRGEAIGTWSAATTIVTIVGPALGGLLAEIDLWRGVFLINLPLAAAALYIVFRRVPELTDRDVDKPLDVLGSALIVIGLAGLTYGFVTAGDRGFGDPPALIALAVGIAAITASVIVESRIDHPLMPPRVFLRSSTFAGANLLTFFLYAALYGVTLFLPLNLVQVQGYRQSAAGLAFLPFSVLMAVLSRWTGKLVDWIGPRPPLIAGPIIAGMGLALLGMTGLTGGPSAYWTTYLPATAVFGLGMAITVAPLTTTVMSALDDQHAGLASGVNNAVSRTAGVLATAAFGAIMLITFRTALPAGLTGVDLTPQQQEQLQAEAADLGNTQPPSGLSSAAKEQVERAIDRAFVSGFRLICFVGAGLAWLSAGMAFLLVEKRIEPVALE